MYGGIVTSAAAAVVPGLSSGAVVATLIKLITIKLDTASFIFVKSS